MKKYITLLFSMALITGASHAQTTEQRIDKQARDKKRAENAAKADVIIMNKKKIFDSTETGLNARDYAFEQKIDKKEDVVKKSAKKKGCKKGCNKATKATPPSQQL